MASWAYERADMPLFVRWSTMNILRLCFAGFAALACATPAFSGQLLEVQVDKSRMLEIGGEVGAVVIGNPSIADVTTHGNKLFVHGRNFGETNLLVLDVEGKTIVDYDLITRHVNETAVAIYKGRTSGSPQRYSYTCYPLCEADIQVGDQITSFASILQSASEKTEFATGSETADAKAPAAPQ
jgi:hypothetical protein